MRTARIALVLAWVMGCGDAGAPPVGDWASQQPWACGLAWGGGGECAPPSPPFDFTPTHAVSTRTPT